MFKKKLEIKKPSIVAFAIGDVNGDNIADKVYLTGEKESDSPFIQNIELVIEDGRRGRRTTIPLKENAGYNPTLFLGDFTGDKLSDILVQIDTGGSGATTIDYIYSFKNNIERLIFDFNTYNESFKYSVNYMDNYKVKVKSFTNNSIYIIDISNKGEDYLSEIYYPDGKLKEPIEGFVNPLSVLLPADIERDGTYELLAFQKVAGRYNADALGYIQNFLKWQNGKFELFNQYLAIFGSEIK